MKRLSPRAIGFGGLAVFAIFRVLSLIFGLFMAPYWQAIDAGILGCVVGGFIAGRLAAHDRVLNAALAAWSALIMIGLAIRMASVVYGSAASLTVLYGALIVAIAGCACGGYAAVALRAHGPPGYGR